MVAKVAQVIGLAVILQFLLFQANLLVSDATVLSPEKLVYQAGDEMVWKDKEWDDSTWTETQPEAGERWWLRATFEWDEQATGGGGQKELVVMLPASYELYWNGILVNVNGTADRPGELDRKLMLPDSLTSSGRHVLAIRVISHPDLGRALPVELAIDDYNAFFQRAVIKNILLFSLAGIFFITAIYYFFLFFISHKKRRDLGVQPPLLLSFPADPGDLLQVLLPLRLHPIPRLATGIPIASAGSRAGVAGISDQ